MDKSEAAQAIADVGTKIQYTGSGMAVGLAFLNTNAAALGVLIGLVGLLVNIFFKFRREAIDRKERQDLIDNLSVHRKGDIPDALEKLSHEQHDED